MKKVNWNLEEVKSFSDLTDEEAVMTNGGDDGDILWWLITVGVGIVNAPAGAALGLVQLGTIEAGGDLSPEELIEIGRRQAQAQYSRRC